MYSRTETMHPFSTQQMMLLSSEYSYTHQLIARPASSEFKTVEHDTCTIFSVTYNEISVQLYHMAAVQSLVWYVH